MYSHFLECIPLCKAREGVYCSNNLNLKLTSLTQSILWTKLALQSSKVYKVPVWMWREAYPCQEMTGGGDCAEEMGLQQSMMEQVMVRLGRKGMVVKGGKLETHNHLHIPYYVHHIVGSCGVSACGSPPEHSVQFALET